MFRISQLSDYIIYNRPFVFHEQISNDTPYKALFFNNIEKIIEGNNAPSFFEELDKNSGKWIVGLVNYEFGGLEIDNRIDSGNNDKTAWFAVCDKVEEYHQLEIDYKEKFPHVENIALSETKSEYLSKIKKIKELLENGETYQVNYTININYELKNNVLDLYLYLRKTQPTKYMYFINTGEKYIISCSPELFFKKKNNKILMSPMKGTSSRSKCAKTDKKNREFLEGDDKNRAENLMIVDMVRNDLGRVCKNIKVLDLFRVEAFNTVHQMVSDICADTNANITFDKIMQSLFPCASITGAPKINTMKIIKNLEKRERGIYTGAIGYITPDNDMCFNVAIRTTEVKNGQGVLGVGGGIVWDSDPEMEYDEAMLKSKFFTGLNRDFEIIETMLIKNKNVLQLEDHFLRMKKSADFFDFPLLWDNFKNIADKSLISVDFNKEYILRYTLNKYGIIDHFLKEFTSQTSNNTWKIKIKKEPVDMSNVFFYHKTTRRDMYACDREKILKEGYDEIIYQNEKGYITEGSISNIYIKKDNNLITPPVRDGLLPGTYREYMLSENKAEVGHIRVDELIKAEEIYVSNSVRGLVRCYLS